ncbi:MAG: DUF1800 domain-containing protein [Acidobacteriota bacterium]|nr:DUF1800 domain-containing protein [Acidobacteriota bacterium]
MWTRSFAVLSLIAVVAGHPQAGGPDPLPSGDDAVTHALNRLTFGPRPDDVARVKAMGLQQWIDQQLDPSRIDDRALTATLARLATLSLDSQTIQREYSGPAMVERRERQQQAGQAGGAGGAGRGREPSEAQRKDRQVIADLEEAKLLRAIRGERQLQEVLADFWFNHFNVFAGKGATRNYLNEYEREAIGPHVLGNFRDMLEASAKSPAMLFYLDNWQNVSENPSAPRRRVAPSPTSGAAASPTGLRPARGINENYARELMELHTLGVDGGYTQADVQNVARALTGWTITPRQGSSTMFVPRLHDDSAKTVLGHAFKAGGGEDDLERVLDILAAHPSTARHIATKLAIRFVSDTPPAALVDRAAARFTATNGNLREVVRTIITSPEFFAPEAYRAKVKTPLEFVASALRATGAEVRTALPLARELRDMGMPLYSCQPPTGYDDTATTWVSAGALVSRMNFAVALGKNQVRGVWIANPPADLGQQIGSPGFQRR